MDQQLSETRDQNSPVFHREQSRSMEIDQEKPNPEVSQPSEAIRFSHVSKGFVGKQGFQPVLKDFSGTVPKGRVVTVVGPSGAGKSTLLSLCNLLESADEGEVSVLGRPVGDWPIRQLRRTVGLVFQTPTVLPGTVLDNLMVSVQLHGGSLTSPEVHLQRVGLSPDLLSQDAQTLSGGQKQRVAMARTLVSQPPVLLLDEVTSSLDLAAAREVEELIVRLQREGELTLLWVTHDLGQAQRVGDETWLLVQGQLVEVAPTGQFFSDPTADTTKQFLAGTLFAGGTQS